MEFNEEGQAGNNIPQVRLFNTNVLKLQNRDYKLADDPSISFKAFKEEEMNRLKEEFVLEGLIEDKPVYDNPEQPGRDGDMGGDFNLDFFVPRLECSRIELHDLENYVLEEGTDN